MMFVVWNAAAFGCLYLVYAWATSAWPGLRSRRALTAGGLACLWATPTALHYASMRWHTLSLASMLSSLVAITLMLTSPWLGLVLLFSRIVRPRPRTDGDGSRAGSVQRRQVLEATSGAALIGGMSSLLGWGFVRGRHAFEIDEVAIPIAGLPRTLDGYVIAQISDIHTGTFVGETELAEGLERVRETRADLVVVTGDLVDIDSAFAPLVARRLADLRPPDGVVACLGNHDYYAGHEQVLAALGRAGVDVLVDSGRVLRAQDSGGFALLGVDDVVSARWGRSGPSLDCALATVPPHLPRILLSHQPPTVDLWAGRIALQLSGHTHGGQINPGFRPADLLFPYVAGRYRVGATTLYVNRGFGTAGPPARVLAPPEVSRIVLVAA
ncbi:MAG: metallophosphoesterase [Polyangiaceae bacterium]|jgi:predicted MPP superfamily phosphohydrolase